MIEKKELKIKWEVVREVIHLGYEYDEQHEATQWNFISQIEDEDLIELYYYCSLQKYTKNLMKDYNLSWNNINQLIKLECDYRKIQL